MTALAQIYIEAFRKQVDEQMLPVWTPDVNVEVGDVGFLRDRQFVPTSNLRKMSLDWEPRYDTAQASWSVVTSESVSLSVDANVSLPGGGELAAGTLKFDKGSGVVASFADVVDESVDDWEALMPKVVSLYMKSVIRYDRVVVWSVRRCASGTVVVSSKSGSSIEVAVDASQLPFGISIDGLGLGATFGKQNGAVFKVASKSGLTPIIRTMRLDETNVLRPTDMFNVAFDAGLDVRVDDPEEAEGALDRITIDQLLDANTVVEL